MRRSALAIVLVVVVLPVVPAGGAIRTAASPAGWPMLHHDPAGTG